MFHCFFNSPARSKYLFFSSFFFNFILWSAGTVKSTILQVLFFLLINIRSCRLAEIRWSACISKSNWSLLVSFSWTYAGLCIYHLFVRSNLNFLHWITLPTQSCLVFYPFSANLLLSLIMWLLVSSLSPRNLLLFCCVLSILALMWLVLMASFCAVIKRDSVSLLRFPFFSHLQVFSCETLLISRLKRPQSCFSSHFCFLVIVVLLIFVLSVLFLVAIISSPGFWM